MSACVSCFLLTVLALAWLSGRFLSPFLDRHQPCQLWKAMASGKCLRLIMLASLH